MILAAATTRPPADGLAFTAVVYGLVLTLWTLTSTARGTALSTTQHAAGAVLGLAGAGIGAAYLVSLAGGHRPPSTGTNVGYALAAILLLPLAWPRGAASMKPRMAAGSACVAALALTVVVLRLRVTW
ncbi:MAG: hypothetical protein AAGC46_07810 [Solirubrobacteraceae bacterium]|nr:hypothetical protein [Patulibacter sp.]